MRKLLFPMLASVASFASPALAQDADTQDIVLADLRRTDITVTATGVDQAPEATGRAVTVIDRDTIETRQTIAVSDLLATVPGVTVSRNGGLGGFTGVRVRGAEAEQTLVLIDGVRVNDPSSPGAGFDFGNLLAGSIERVDVLRGANSVAWGSQAIGGVVNIVTRKQNGFSANAEYGANDTVSANSSFFASAGALSGGVSGGYLRSSGFSTATSGKEDDGYEQFGASGRLRLDISERVGLDFAGYYAHSRLDLDGFPPPDFLTFGDTAEYSTAQEIYAYAGLRADFSERLRNRFSFTLADINRDNYDPSFGSEPSFIGRGRSERYGWRGDYGFDPLRLVLGVEHEDSRFSDGFLRKSTGITSVYGEAVLDPIDTVTLTAGVRHDDHRAFGGHTSFGADASWRVAGNTRLRASYAEGFKAPSLYQLYSDFGSEDLRPETARSYDVGVEQGIGPVRLDAGWFHRDTRNQIDFDLLTSTSANIARTRASGIEAGLTARPLEGLTVQGSYTHLVAENRSKGANFGRDLARRPRDSGSLSIDYRTHSGLGFGGTLLAAGDSFDDAGNAVRLKGYAVLGLRGAVPVTDRFSVYGRVDNLFDATYETVAGYATEGRAAHIGVRARIG